MPSLSFTYRKDGQSCHQCSPGSPETGSSLVSSVHSLTSACQFSRTSDLQRRMMPNRSNNYPQERKMVLFEKSTVGVWHHTKQSSTLFQLAKLRMPILSWLPNGHWMTETWHIMTDLSQESHSLPFSSPQIWGLDPTGFSGKLFLTCVSGLLDHSSLSWILYYAGKRSQLKKNPPWLRSPEPVKET